MTLLLLAPLALAQDVIIEIPSRGARFCDAAEVYAEADAVVEAGLARVDTLLASLDVCLAQLPDPPTVITLPSPGQALAPGASIPDIAPLELDAYLPNAGYSPSCGPLSSPGVSIVFGEDCLDGLQEVSALQGDLLEAVDACHTVDAACLDEQAAELQGWRAALGKRAAALDAHDVLCDPQPVSTASCVQVANAL